jgi:hypothetical protein
MVHISLLHGTHLFTTGHTGFLDQIVYLRNLPFLPISVVCGKELEDLFTADHTENYQNLPQTTLIGKLIHMESLPQTTLDSKYGKFKLKNLPQTTQPHVSSNFIFTADHTYSLILHPKTLPQTTQGMKIGKFRLENLPQTTQSVKVKVGKLNSLNYSALYSWNFCFFSYPKRDIIFPIFTLASW